jgi:hypothetical protein
VLDVVCDGNEKITEMKLIVGILAKPWVVHYSQLFVFHSHDDVFNKTDLFKLRGNIKFRQNFKFNLRERGNSSKYFNQDKIAMNQVNSSYLRLIHRDVKFYRELIYLCNKV